MHRSRRLGFVAGIAALVAVAGACGGGSSSPSANAGAARVVTRDPVRLLAASADAVSAAKSAKMSIAVALTVSGKSVTVTADGAFDFKARAGELTMDMSAMGLPGGRGRMQARVLGSVVYMNLGDLIGATNTTAARELGGKHWVKLDSTTLADQGGAAGFGTLGSSDPTSTLDALRGVASDVKDLGHESVRGADTTHYAVTIDLTKALGHLPAASRDAAAQSLKMFGEGSVPADVWIDGDGRPRKFMMNLDATHASGTTLGALTLELYDYGTPVDVQAPPDSDTFDMTSMLGGAGGLGGLGGGNAAGSA